MTNTPSWDRLAARAGTFAQTDTVLYGPDGPSERELRLLGDVRGKRVLDLGCGEGQAAVALARQGAVTIAVDASEGQLARARLLAEEHEARAEWHLGDVADLAFLRADSIDVVFSACALGEVDDLARAFRQIQRVLRPNAPFAFSHEHPFALASEAGGPAMRSYLDRTPLVITRNGEQVTIFPRPISEIHVELLRAGFRVDVIAEPEPPAAHDGAALPLLVWRARKDGS